MMNIIKADLYRIFKGKAIYISLLIIVVMALFSTVGMSAGTIGISTGSNIDINDVEFL